MHLIIDGTETTVARQQDSKAVIENAAVSLKVGEN